MAEALYRKYRSKSFDELAAQDHVAKTLKRAIEQGKLSHAYLFTGPRGVGKTSAARILAHQINSLEYSSKPHLDIIEIDAASNRRIEDVRDLREKVHIAPASAEYKIYIIDEVHMLTNESFNALLKTLEEPPAHVIFILATTELHKLPATITSRTQRFAFAPPSEEAIAAHLKYIAGQETIKISPEALSLLATHADGSFRDGITLLDQVASSWDNKAEIDETTVAEMLGLPPMAAIESLLENVMKHNPAETAKNLAELKAVGMPAPTIALALSRLVATKAHENPAMARLLDELIAVPRHTYPEAKLLAVLLNAAHSGASTETPPSAPKPKSMPLKVTPAPEPAPAVEVKSTAKPAPKPPAGAPLEQWGDVLAALPAGSATLRGTLKTAEVRINGTTVVLAFKNSFGSKKMETSKHKLALSAAFTEVLGLKNVTIESVIDANAVPTPTKVPDSNAAAIIDAMGGGEMVEL